MRRLKVVCGSETRELLFPVSSVAADVPRILFSHCHPAKAVAEEDLLLPFNLADGETTERSSGEFYPS